MIGIDSFLFFISYSIIEIRITNKKITVAIGNLIKVGIIECIKLSKTRTLKYFLRKTFIFY